MPLSLVARACLESNAYFIEDIFNTRVGINPVNRKRKECGEFASSYEEYRENPDKFFEYTRVTVDTFDYILSHIKDDDGIKVHPSRFRAVTPEEKLFLTLRYLGHGLSNGQLSQAYRLGRSTVSKSIFRTLKVIWKKLEKLHLFPPSCEDLQQTSNAFYLKWQIPNCIGCLDEKYFRIKIPPHSEDYKSKKLFSMVLQGITDADYKFLAIEVGSKSKKGGAGTFHTSQLNTTLSENKFNIPPPRKLPGTNTIIPHVLIGSEAFPLKHFLMRPFPSVKIKDDQIIFNKRLSRASVSFRCAFGVLTSKFGIFSKPIETNKKHSELIIKVACLLHNIVREREGDRDEHFLEFWENYTDSDDSTAHRKSKSRRNNRATAQALLIRNNLKQYFIDHPLH